MERLHEKDLYAALEFVRDVGAARDLDAFRNAVVGGLGRLVPCDIATYDEIDPRNGAVFWITDPLEHSDRADGEAFLRNISEHPLIHHHRRTGDGAPCRFSDFLTRRQFQRTALYNEFFRPLEIETQIAALFYGPMPAIIGMSLNGEHRDFSERDRQILDLVRPYLAHAYEAVLAVARNERLLQAIEGAAEENGAGAVVLTGDQLVAAATPTALTRLRDYFGDGNGSGLPAPVVDWVPEQRASRNRRPDELPKIERELQARRQGGSLSVRFLGGDSPAEPDTLLLEERRPGPSPQALRKLGLTRRESEVLALIAAGRSNLEIADVLVISPLTVKKHAEHIYAKLGVRGRGQAAARAHEVTAI